VLRDPVAGRVVALVASNATSKGTSDASFPSLDAEDLVVDQVSDAVSIALATNVPY